MNAVQIFVLLQLSLAIVYLTPAFIILMWLVGTWLGKCWFGEQVDNQ